MIIYVSHGCFGLIWCKQQFAFLRCRRWWHYLRHAALVVENFITATNELRRHTMSIKDHNALVIDIPIQLSLRCRHPCGQAAAPGDQRKAHFGVKKWRPVSAMTKSTIWRT